MTVINKPLFEAKLAEVAATVQYTVPAATRTIIDKITVTNTTLAAQTIDVHLVPTTGTPGAGNKIVSKSIAAGVEESLEAMAGHAMDPGATIVTSASALALTIRASGREVT